MTYSCQVSSNFRRCMLLVVLAVGATGFEAFGREMFILRGDAHGTRLDACGVVRWQDETLLYSRAGGTVKLLDISNGTPHPLIAREFSLPARRVVALSDTVGGSWRPTTDSIQHPVWFMRIDVPEDTIISSAISISAEQCGTGPILTGPTRGKVTSRVFEGLAPAGLDQIHLGTDLGYVESRLNVGVYNAGETVGNGRVELRRSCDDTLAAAVTISVPPDTLVQFRLSDLVRAERCTASERLAPEWSYFTVVTLDQPSISYTANVANREPFGLVGITSEAPPF